MVSQNMLSPEDYLEPSCLLCHNPSASNSDVQAVPMQRIIDKLDAYMSHRDYENAERHLLYWLGEAERGNDLRGQLMLCSELVGHYRKTAQKEQAFLYADRALQLLQILNYEDTITAGTTYVNIATAYTAFGKLEDALDLFQKAQAVYESSSFTQQHLLGGLYNNMALVYKELHRFPEAYQFFEKAMKVMGDVAGGSLEQAITCLNIADTVAADVGMESGESRIFQLLDQAYDLLHDESVPHDGYYAFVCEKCAPSFSFYGYFLAASELQEEAKNIYERT